MRVLIACESSGVERDAFLALGHDAMSCDLLPTEAPGPHYQGDAADLIGEHWDLVIAHPHFSVSQSESGFEKIMQATTLILEWPVTAPELIVTLQINTRKP